MCGTFILNTGSTNALLNSEIVVHQERMEIKIDCESCPYFQCQVTILLLAQILFYESKWNWDYFFL